MKLLSKTPKLVKGQSYTDDLTFRVDIDPEVRAVVVIEVRVERTDAVWRKSGVEVSLPKDFTQERLRKEIHLSRVADVPGLRQLVLTAAENLWAQFKPSESEQVAALKGHYDNRVTVETMEHGKGQRVHVTFANLPYSGYELYGDLEVLLPTDDRAEFVMRRYYSSITDGKSKSIHSPSVSSTHYPAIMQYLRPERAREIVSALLQDMTFTCHKTTVNRRR